MYRPKNCMKCGGKKKAQFGISQQVGISQEDNQLSGQQDTFKFQNPNTGIHAPIPDNPVYSMKISNDGDPVDYQTVTPQKKQFDPFWILRGVQNGLSWLSNKVDRNRQDRYDWMQQTALGEVESMPPSNFQPNPYNLYMQNGGNLKNIISDYNMFSNDSAMDMGDGKLDDNGKMAKGGYEIDRMMVMKMIPELLKMGKLGTSKYRHMKKGGIHINPENKGKFTESAKSAGMGVQEFARHVLANKEDYSSTQVKRANFARNASKWKEEEGGEVYLQVGGIPQAMQDATFVSKKPIYNSSRTLSWGELSALANQFRGWKHPMNNESGITFVKNHDPIKNNLGFLTPEQASEVNKYMNSATILEKIWEALPSPFGGERLPLDSKLKNQKKGGEMKDGGLSANKARKILHDKSVHGKPLTDKQRRFFGAMSKGHTNFKK